MNRRSFLSSALAAFGAVAVKGVIPSLLAAVEKQAPAVEAVSQGAFAEAAQLDIGWASVQMAILKDIYANKIAAMAYDENPFLKLVPKDDTWVDNNLVVPLTYGQS